MKIGQRQIGPDEEPYIVAELSANHNGNIKLAREMIEAAADCGADAVKVQCYTADSICANDGTVVEGGPWAGKKLYELYKEAETPPAMVKEMFEYAKSRKITLFSSVFDFAGVDFVSKLGVECIKIASFELTDTPLIRYAASTGLGVIISTGMGTSQEVIAAINAYNAGNLAPLPNLGLLHCVSSYPARADEANLPALGPLSDLLGGRHVVGFSDHTLGIGSAVAAVAWGASIIEKHFILDRCLGGPDSSFSMEPHQFSAMVKAVREAWQATRHSAPKKPYVAYRKSLHIVCDLKEGDLFSPENLRILRPSTGLAASSYASVLGRPASRDLKAGTPLQPDMFVS